MNIANVNSSPSFHMDTLIEDSQLDALESGRADDSLGIKNGSSVRVGPRRDGGGSGSGQHDSRSFGEPVLDQPSNSADYKVGTDTYSMVVMELLNLAESIMDRRAARLELMQEISLKMEANADKEADKAIEQTKKALKKKKSGIFGKIMAALTIVVSAVLIATGVGTALGTAMLVVGLAMAIDTFATGGAITGKVMKGLATPFTETLKACGVPDQIAEMVGQIIVMVIMAVASGGSSSTASSARTAQLASKLAQATTKSATKAAAAGHTVKAEKMLAVSQKMSDLSVKSARSATKSAQKLSDEAAELATKTKEGSAKLIKAQKKANEAQKHAREASESAETAWKGVNNARTQVQGPEKAKALYDIRKAAATQHSNKPGVEKMDKFEDVTREIDYSRIHTIAQVTNVAFDSVSSGVEASYQIINAQLDYLIAQDQADIKELKAIFALLQELMETMGELNESDQTLFDGTMAKLNDFLRNTLASLHKPLFPNRA